MPAMIDSLILTNATDLAHLEAALYEGDYSGVKVVTGWGLGRSWTDEDRRRIVEATDNLIIRTVAGDPSYNGGQYLYPVVDDVIAELEPWFAACPDCYYEIGNEPNIARTPPVDPYVYTFYLAETIARIREDYPKARILGPAMIADSSLETWVIILRDSLALCDAAAIHAYAWRDYLPDDNGGQLQHALAVYDRQLSGLPLMLTEYGIHGSDVSDQLKAERDATMLATLPATVTGAARYHAASPAGDGDQAAYAVSAAYLDAYAAAKESMVSDFAYIGVGLTLPAFEVYVEQYEFGSIPPDYVVVHSTIIPSATWALYPGDGDVWDEGEQGMTRDEQYRHRKAKLDGIMRFYRDTNGWNAGPHLFIDDIWIWLFTPMYDIGIHAADGNSCHDANGNLHYSIGVEVVGYYESVQWPAAVAANVAGAIQALHNRLGNFAYAHVAGPGGISRHADWNKPECPGSAISMEYILKTVTPVADTGRYAVKPQSIGATVVLLPHAIRQMIAPGAWWDGPTVQGPLMTLAGYGTSDEYVGDNQHGFIWKPLLNNRP